jgi:hypothetical protein
MATGTMDKAAADRLARFERLQQKYSEPNSPDPGAAERLARFEALQNRSAAPGPATAPPAPARPTIKVQAKPVQVPGNAIAESVSSIGSEPLGMADMARELHWTRQDTNRAGLEKLRQGENVQGASDNVLFSAASEIDRSIKPLDMMRNAISGQHNPLRSRVYQELKTRGYPDEVIDQVIRQGDEKGFWGKVLEGAPEAIGGMVGAGVGGLTRNPAIGATVSSAVGGALGRGLKEYYNRQARPERAVRGDELKKDLLKAGAVEGLGEAGGRVVLGTLAKAVKPITDDKVLRDGYRLNDELMAAGKQATPDDLPFLAGSAVPKGVDAGFTPAQLTASRTLATLETVAEKSVGGQEIMYIKKGRLQPAAFKRWLKNVNEELTDGITRGLRPDEVGVVLNDALDGSSTAWKRAASALYSKVDQTAVVDMRKAKAQAQAVLDDIAQGKALGGNIDRKQVLEDVTKLMDGLDFEHAHNVRSDILEVKRALELAGHGKSLRKLSMVADEVDKAMEATAKGLSKENYINWRQANEFYRDGIERFENKLIAKLSRDVSENPAAAVRTIFSGDNATSVEKMKKVLLGTDGKTAAEIADGKQTWDDLRFAWLDHSLRKGMDDTGEQLIGRTFNKSLRQMENSLPLMFSSAELARIEDISRMAQAIQAPTGGTGGVLVSILQAGAVGGLAGSDRVGSAAAILGGPAVLARVMASDSGSKAIVKGLREIANAGRVSSGTNGRIIAHMVETRNRIEKEREARRIREERLELLEDRRRATRGKSPSRGFGSSLR